LISFKNQPISNDAYAGYNSRAMMAKTKSNDLVKTRAVLLKNHPKSKAGKPVRKTKTNIHAAYAGYDN